MKSYNCFDLPKESNGFWSTLWISGFGILGRLVQMPSLLYQHPTSIFGIFANICKWVFQNYLLMSPASCLELELLISAYEKSMYTEEFGNWWMGKICLSMRNLFNSSKNHKQRITDAAFLWPISCNSVHDPDYISTSNCHNTSAMSFPNLIKEKRQRRHTVNYPKCWKRLAESFWYFLCKF